MAFSDTLKKEIGPLPVGAWLVVVGAGLTFAWYKKRNTPTTTNNPSNTAMAPLTDQTIGNIGGLLSMLNNGQSGPSTQTVQDNTSWYQQAVRLLLGRGNDPSLVDSALRKYMQGMPLTVPETAIRDLALQLVGPMPSPPPPPSTEPTGGQPIWTIQPVHDLAHFKVNPNLTPANIQHLSDYDLMSAYNITGLDFPYDPMWQDVVASQYGTSDPLVYANELARRYQAGLLPAGILTGPVGPWTSGQPAWVTTWEKINDSLSRLAGLPGNVSRVSWSV